MERAEEIAMLTGPSLWDQTITVRRNVDVLQS